MQLKGLPLADSNPQNKPLEVDVLIGSDHYWDFIRNDIIRGESGPVAISSNLGYILSGGVAESKKGISSTTNVVSTHRLGVEAREVAPKYNVKAVYGVEKSQISVKDYEVLQRFEETTIFKEGRYEVELPFIDD